MLIKDLNEFKQYVAVNNSFRFENIASYVGEVEEDQIKPLLGDALYGDLLIAYEDNNLTDAQTELLKKCQAPLANLAFLESLPFVNLQISDSGMRNATGKDGEFRPASRWQYEEISKQCRKSGYKGLEFLLRFLIEDSKKPSPSYGNWDYAGNHDGFLPNALEFDVHCFINESRLIYLKMLPEMKRQERIVAKAISQQQYDAFLAILQDKNTDFSVEENEVFETLCRAIANMTFGNSFHFLPIELEGDRIGIYNNQFMADFTPHIAPDKDIKAGMALRHQELGDEALQEAIDLMEADLTSFPLYEEHAYTAPEDKVEFDNDGGFVMF